MKRERVIIPECEYKARVEKAQQMLQEAGWSGMVLSAESNMHYYTGYRTHLPWGTFTRPMFLFLPAEGTPIVYTQGFVTQEAIARAPHLVHRSFMSMLGPTPQELYELMEEVHMTQGIVGFEVGHEQRINYQVDTYLALTKLLDKVEVADASKILWKQRIIKSPKEIECHKRACEATSYAFDRIFEEVCEGMDEFEITNIVRRAMLQGGADKDGFVIITAGPGNYNRTSSVSSNRRLQKGDMLWLDLGCEYEGYYSDFCRAGIVGPVDDQRKRMQEDVYKATMEAGAKIRPGLAVKDLAKACGYGLESRGYEVVYDFGRLGHGMGLVSTEPPSVTIFEEGELQAGMIINIEPTFINEKGVFCLEENYVVTEDGAYCMSGSSRELHSIPTL